VRGSRSECYVPSSAGARKGFFVAMAHDCVLDWMIKRPPPGQTAVDFLVIVSSFVLPRMQACVAGEWSVQPERCVLVLCNALLHDNVAVESLRGDGALVFLMPPYSLDFNSIEDIFSVGGSWLRRWSSPDQFNAWSMTTNDAMLLHITGDICREFVKAAVRRHNL